MKEITCLKIMTIGGITAECTVLIGLFILGGMIFSPGLRIGLFICIGFSTFLLYFYDFVKSDNEHMNDEADNVDKNIVIFGICFINVFAVLYFIMLIMIR